MQCLLFWHQKKKHSYLYTLKSWKFTTITYYCQFVKEFYGEVCTDETDETQTCDWSILVNGHFNCLNPTLDKNSMPAIIIESVTNRQNLLRHKTVSWHAQKRGKFTKMKNETITKCNCKLKCFQFISRTWLKKTAEIFFGDIY